MTKRGNGGEELGTLIFTLKKGRHGRRGEEDAKEGGQEKTGGGGAAEEGVGGQKGG